MTDTRPLHSNRPPRLQIFSSGRDNYKSSAQVVIVTNYQLGVAGGKIIEDASAVANLNQLNIRNSNNHETNQVKRPYIKRNFIAPHAEFLLEIDRDIGLYSTWSDEKIYS